MFTVSYTLNGKSRNRHFKYLITANDFVCKLNARKGVSDIVTNETDRKGETCDSMTGKDIAMASGIAMAEVNSNQPALH